MAVDILIKFNDPAKDSGYVPVAAQGTYRTIWMPIAKRLGLFWLSEFFPGTTVPGKYLPEVIDEFRQVRAELIRNPPQSTWWRSVDAARLIERVDFILEKLTELDPNEIAELIC